MQILEGDDFDETIAAAVDAAPDLLIVLAGDGTACAAATRCGAEGPLVAPLAGGTMNMLPHALYGAKPWQEGLRDALTEGVVRPVSGGVVGGQYLLRRGDPRRAGAVGPRPRGGPRGPPAYGGPLGAQRLAARLLTQPRLLPRQRAAAGRRTP